MDGKEKGKSLLKSFLLYVIFFLGVAAFLVFVTDPFFHYHAPWLGIAPVQSTYQYQTQGVLDHFEYDSILAGSSVVMSMDTGELDQYFGCRTVKAVGNSAPAPLLLSYLERAYQSHEIKNIFYGLDIFSFYNDPDMKVYEKEVDYIINNNPFDDIKYLLNGSVIGEKIPDMLAATATGYDEGLAYAFNQNSKSGPEVVLADYFSQRNEDNWEKPEYEDMDVTENIRRLEAMVSRHGETRFCFFMPAYSILWWNRAHEQGMMEEYLETLGECFQILLPYDNVEIYSTNFNNASIIMDLDQYIDLAHGSVEVTEMMAREIGEGGRRITLSNYEEELSVLNDVLGNFRERVEKEGIEKVFYLTR